MLSTHHRGYIPPGSFTLRENGLKSAKKPNFSESFTMSPETKDICEEDRSFFLAGENRWPQETDFPGFRELVETTRDGLIDVAFRLIRALLHSVFGEVRAEEILKRDFAKPYYFFRLLHYPPPPDVNTVCCAPHTDYGCMALLVQDKSGGLQVQIEADSPWLDVEPVHGAIVMNVGDALAHWSGGLLRATKHQVVYRQRDRSRYSNVMFFDPALSTALERPESESEDGKPMVYFDLLKSRLTTNYAELYQRAAERES